VLLDILYYTHCIISAQAWRNRTLIGHELTIVHFLVLPGSLLPITEMTEYLYFSVIWTLDECKYESDQDVVPLVLIIGPIPFL